MKNKKRFKKIGISFPRTVSIKEKDLPNNLKVDPFFVKIISLKADELFKFNLSALKEFGYTEIESLEDSEQGFIFAKGTLPVCLCAHMDKVPYYKPIKKINRQCVINKNKSIDVYISSKEGIGGDDRCGVYAILQMLKLGHRPSVLFCMGEEIGCKGSRKFTELYPKEFLSDINAFIQIDRRGSKDVVRYSDTNDELTKAIEAFNFKHAYGSCSDISILMPHFGISGVNLSSGYYNEHSSIYEYISIRDVNYLLERLNNILSSDIFNKKYEYKMAEIKSFYFPSYYKQMSLFDYNDFSTDEEEIYMCDHCGETHFLKDMVEVSSDFYCFVCEDCAKTLIKQGFTRCPSCNILFENVTAEGEPEFIKDFCPFCGSILD